MVSNVPNLWNLSTLNNFEYEINISEKVLQWFYT